jgi:hypothetical protein
VRERRFSPQLTARRIDRPAVERSPAGCDDPVNLAAPEGDPLKRDDVAQWIAVDRDQTRFQSRAKATRPCLAGFLGIERCRRDDRIYVRLTG